jgi:dihydrodipicolinate synthase/N-acetylneuraminate lyase
VVPTTFHEDGTLDLASQKRCLDFMIDSGVDGLCILANFSEQFLLADLQAGATGSMTGGGFADRIRPIIEAHRNGDPDTAFALYQRWLPLINHENRQAGFLAAKALMKEGGVIACEAPRHPWPAMHPETRKGLIETARRLDPLVLRWA